VATIVLQSGDEHAGQWINEKRDFVADYVKFFGKKPKKSISLRSYGRYRQHGF